MNGGNKPEPISHMVMFWLLSGMAVTVVLPCFWVPPIEALGALNAVERREMMHTAELEQQIAQQKRLAEALRSDPLLNARLAQRELGYQQLGMVEHVEALPPISEPASPSTKITVIDPMPRWIRSIYPTQLAHVYRQERSRHLLALLSISLILFTILTYARQTRYPPISNPV